MCPVDCVDRVVQREAIVQHYGNYYMNATRLASLFLTLSIAESILKKSYAIDNVRTSDSKP